MNAVIPQSAAPWRTAVGNSVQDFAAPSGRGQHFHYDTILEPSLFWFWNASASEESIQRRLDDFLSKGVRAVHVHPMPDDFRRLHFQQGMPIPYLSDEFFALIAFTCEQMRQREMLLWLYDEGGWPSGVAGGSVVSTDSSYGLWALQKNGERIEPIQPYLKEGFPDLMNPHATQRFIELTHEKYRRTIGHEFGHTVLGIFTDEPRLGSRVGTDTIPWSPLVPEAYAQEYGHALEEVLPLLFLPDPVDERVRLAHRNYLSIISTLIANNYYRPIREWCDRWGLIFEGHHSGEDEFSRHGQYFGDFIQQARNYHIPGIDAIWRQIFPGQETGNYASLASSISWLRNERCALSESFNVYGPGLTLQEMQWIAAFQIVRGVNKIAFMPSLDGTSGVRWAGMGTDISPKTPVWRDFDIIVDFVRNAAKFSASGQAAPAVGMYYRSELVAETEAAEFDLMHERVCNHIHDSLSGLIFVGLEDVQSGQVSEGRLELGPVRLGALFVHTDGPLTEEEIAAFQKLAWQGFAVWWVHRENAAAPLSCRKVSVDAARARELPDFHHVDLADYAPVVLESGVTGVRLLAMQEDGLDSLLFFNQNPHSVEFSFRLRNSRPNFVLQERPLEDDAAIRQTVPFAENEAGYNVQLLPGQMLALQSVPESETIPPAVWRQSSSRELSLNWQVLEEERYILGDDVEIESGYDTRRPGELGDYSRQHSDFSGTLVYSASFVQDSPLVERTILDLGTVYYSAEVLINGQCCGRRAWSPFRFDITPHLKLGANELTIKVTNTLANQWTRHEHTSQSLEADGNPYLPRTSKFMLESLHAGLDGPLAIESFEKIDSA